MTESDFKTAYNDDGFPPLAVTVDAVLFSIDGSRLRVALLERAEAPECGRLALPGSFIRPKEDLEAAAVRVVQEKLGVAARVRQFHTFGSIDRDPRLRVIAVAYMAALPMGHDDRIAAMLAEYCDGAVFNEDKRVDLPFDHAEMVAAAVADMRLNLDITDWAFNFLSDEFSLRELQQVHEAIRGRSVNKPAFRKRLLQSGWLEATGRMETGKGFRPAELYRVRPGGRAPA